jgi:UDP-N-acetylglucosamine:LPS N-acetylglucosamine transferase
MGSKSMIKEKAILFIYGEGGHRAEMQRLFNYIDEELVVESDVKYISIYENGDILDSINIGYEMPIIRDKYSKFKTIMNIFTKPYKIISTLFQIKKEYNVKIILSTGPGISILPIIFFKLFNARTIHFETDSRFMTKSLSGEILYYLVDKFYVPNKSLLKLYKKSEFSGQL